MVLSVEDDTEEREGLAGACTYLPHRVAAIPQYPDEIVAGTAVQLIMR